MSYPDGVSVTLKSWRGRPTVMDVNLGVYIQDVSIGDDGKFTSLTVAVGTPGHVARALAALLDCEVVLGGD